MASANISGESAVANGSDQQHRAKLAAVFKVQHTAPTPVQLMSLLLEIVRVLRPWLLCLDGALLCLIIFVQRVGRHGRNTVLQLPAQAGSRAGTAAGCSGHAAAIAVPCLVPITAGEKHGKYQRPAAGALG